MNSACSDQNSIHIPVLKKEVFSCLRIRPNGIYLDGTVGLGGHAQAVLAALSNKGQLIGLDSDGEAIKRCHSRLSHASSCHLFHGSYSNFPVHLESLGICEVDGMFLDLGLSSFQLDSPQRGFSYRQDGPLDMRFDVTAPLTAEGIVNDWNEDDLVQILQKYGEERRAKRLVKAIIEKRGGSAVRTTLDLRSIISEVTPERYLTKTLSRVFQALRITVNRELESLQQFLALFSSYLKLGGRIVIISYHSLEDRLVKARFRQLQKGCICPPDLPQCRCGKQPELGIITRKVIRPGADEIAHNSRARSARLRAAEKTG